MLFKKVDSGAELRSVTGNWFAINSAISAWPDLMDAQREVENVIGTEVIQWAEKEYKSEEHELPEGVYHLQRAIAYLAAIRYYKKTDIAHDTGGRKIKINANTEKIPWEWQLLDDDKAHLEAHYRALDSAITWCENEQLEAWIGSNKRKEHSELFINTLSVFERFYPIHGSWRTYMMLVPFIREVERDEIAPILSTGFRQLNDSLLSDLVRSAIVLLSIAKAIKRMPLIFDDGVNRRFTASGTQRQSTPASFQEIARIAANFENEAKVLIAKIKRMRQNVEAEVIMPINHQSNKFFNF